MSLDRFFHWPGKSRKNAAEWMCSYAVELRDLDCLFAVVVVCWEEVNRLSAAAAMWDRSTTSSSETSSQSESHGVTASQTTSASQESSHMSHPRCHVPQRHSCYDFISHKTLVGDLAAFTMASVISTCAAGPCGPQELEYRSNPCPYWMASKAPKSGFSFIMFSFAWIC